MEKSRSIETEGILFLVQTHKPWNLLSEGEYDTFYDPLQKRIVLLQSPHIYAFETYDKSKDPNPIYFMLPSKCKRAESLAISHNDRCVAVQDSLLHINFVDFGPPTPPTISNQKQAVILPKECGLSFSSGYTKILGMSFVQSQYFDFVVAHCKGLEIYKFDTNKRNLVSAKSISHASMNAWINPLDCVVILSSSGNNKGEMTTYHLRKDEQKLKKIEGPVFSLMLRPQDPPNATKAEKQQRDAKAQKFYCEIPQLLTRNIKFYNEEVKMLEKKRAEGFQMHKLLLTKIYLRSVFLHYNQSQGTIQVYRLHPEKVQKSLDQINLDPTLDYIVQVSDNLLLVTNTTNNLFSIYDSKSAYKLREALFRDGHIDLSYSDKFTCDNIEDSEVIGVGNDKNLEEGFVIAEPKIYMGNLLDDPEEIKNEDSTGILSNTYLELKTRLIDDNLPLKIVEESKLQEGSPKAVPPSQAKLTDFIVKDYFYLDADIAFDQKFNRFFTYFFNKGKYLQCVSKKVPGLINLMRRQKPKGIILNALKQLMEKCISLHKLSVLFERISSVFHTSVQKGIVHMDKSTIHEVKRITAIVPLVAQTYYKPGQVKPAIYVSKSADQISVFKVFFAMLFDKKGRKNSIRGNINFTERNCAKCVLTTC